MEDGSLWLWLAASSNGLQPFDWWTVREKVDQVWSVNPPPPVFMFTLYATFTLNNVINQKQYWMNNWFFFFKESNSFEWVFEKVFSHYAHIRRALEFVTWPQEKRSWLVHVSLLFYSPFFSFGLRSDKSVSTRAVETKQLLLRKCLSCCGEAAPERKQGKKAKKRTQGRHQGPFFSL